MPASADLALGGEISPEVESLELKVEFWSLSDLKPYSGNARTHSKKQVAQIAASMRRFGFVSPVLLADDGTIIAGHARVEAARLLGLSEAPCIRLSHLSPAERRAYVIADNRLAELGGWSLEILAEELKGLAALDLEFDLEITGFEGAQLDRLLDPQPSPADAKADRIPEATGPAVTRLGDVWRLGDHRLLCGDARSPEAYQALMGEERARLVFTDPPYNVEIDGNVGGLGRVERRPFVMGSGEMTSDQFTAFLRESLGSAVAVSVDGAIHFVCMDWRHMVELQAAGSAVYSELKNLAVWVKENGGMGTFYRSRHELVAIYKVGAAAHVNTFGLGETGRYRTNVWEYPGVNSFGHFRDDALGMHPTVKPVAMVADAIRDVSRRREIVLDPFGGSGTTLIAAQKTGRRARLLELDPLYCDVICRRWATFSGQSAALAPSGAAFELVASSRFSAGQTDG